MNKLWIIMVVGFTVAFGAGLTMGMLWERRVAANPGVELVPPPAAPKPSEVPWIRDMKPPLTDVQRQQIADIWKNAMKVGPQHGQKREKLREDKNEAIHKLMDDATNKQYQDLYAKTEERIRELDRKSRADQDAERKHRDELVKALFNDEQRKQYQAILDDYRTKSDALNEEWKKSFETAVAAMKTVLTPDQFKQYENMRHGPPQNGHQNGGREGRGWGDRMNNGQRHGPPPNGGPGGDAPPPAPKNP